jgi:hypothetical protein
VNVQIGAHLPPPYYEVPIHMRQLQLLSLRRKMAGIKAGVLLSA